LRRAELIALAFRVPGYRELFENYIRRRGEIRKTEVAQQNNAEAISHPRTKSVPSYADNQN
jgi:hypothetical protein